MADASLAKDARAAIAQRRFPSAPKRRARHGRGTTPKRTVKKRPQYHLSRLRRIPRGTRPPIRGTTRIGRLRPTWSRLLDTGRFEGRTLLASPVRGGGQRVPGNNRAAAGRPGSARGWCAAGNRDVDRRSGADRRRDADCWRGGGALILGFLFIGAIVYFTVVWSHLPTTTWVRWLVTGAVAVAVAVIWIAVRKWSPLREKLKAQGSVVRRWGLVASDFLMFLLIVGAVIVASIVLDAEDQVVLLKLFTVLYFSMLPAILYLQFSSRKTLTVWKEYVLNLYKLGADDLANLPRPPTLSRFHKPWKEARDSAFPGALDDKVARKLELANIYRVKFRDLFGPVPDVEGQRSVLSLRSVHKLQVVITTILITIGWIFVGPTGGRVRTVDPAGRLQARPPSADPARNLLVRVPRRVLLHPPDAHSPVLPERSESDRVHQRDHANRRRDPARLDARPAVERLGHPGAAECDRFCHRRLPRPSAGS